MDRAAGFAMLATVGGTLALLLGLLLLLLPLLVSELSRPRDSVWGAVVLLLGLVLVTSADRLTGAPMLAVLCGGLLIGRLSSEVGLGRWRQLTDDERQLLISSERWSRSFQQLAASCTSLVAKATALVSGLVAAVASRPQRPGSSKRWVRPELPEAALQATAGSSGVSISDGTSSGEAIHGEASNGEATAAAHGSQGPAEPAEAPMETADPDPAGAPQAPNPATSAATDQRSRVVRDFEEITALLAAAPAAEAPAADAPAEEAEASEAG